MSALKTHIENVKLRRLVTLTDSPSSQIKKTAYAQSSQIRQIRKKMVEIMTREASSCDLKELVGKFIPEAIGEQRRSVHSCHSNILL